MEKGSTSASILPPDAPKLSAARQSQRRAHVGGHPMHAPLVLRERQSVRTPRGSQSGGRLGEISTRARSRARRSSSSKRCSHRKIGQR